ncbi:MAG: UDP-2,4-diacetamido-2,4,6-trideoxy-beta-L-altropyranose hydrolase [Bacteroidia bacterium]|nr:UDP-2,4-diacetamido-2,4,6-trideoxy-beta-L-altropyranose hydrolase [Bacteroidia bacterium]
MKKHKLFFRADGSSTTGYGHVMRLLSVASMLNEKYDCIFLTQCPDTFLKTQIKLVCTKLIELPAHKNILQEAKYIADTILTSQDVIMLDGYNFDTNYQRTIKKKCFKLVCIDDLFDKHFVADAIINHSEGINTKKYSIEHYTKLYLGTKYSILRKSFLGITPVFNYKNKAHRVFINMGGSDEFNYSLKALKLALSNSSVKHIDIVVGSFYKFKTELNNIINKNTHLPIVIHTNVSEADMCNLMQLSTIAICSASTVAYEYASVGGILFLYKTVSNQKNIYSFLLKSNIGYKATNFNTKLIDFENKENTKLYFKNKVSFFTGKSNINISAIFEQFDKERSIIMRLAIASDSIIYYQWANEPAVRLNSINQAKIPIEAHESWFSARIKSKNTFLYYFESNKIALGQVRLDIQNNIAEIDYSIDALFRKQGYGELILQMAINHFLTLHPTIKITATVKESNIGSNKIFEKMKFTKTKNKVVNDSVYANYNLKIAKQ